MISKNEIDLDGPAMIVEMVGRLQDRYNYLLTDESESVQSFLCKVVKENRHMEFPCRYLSRFFDD